MGKEGKTPNRKCFPDCHFEMGYNGAMIRLIVFLGNPGAEYAETRHNVARRLLPELSFHSNLEWQQKFKGQYAETRTPASKVWLLVPDTFMNKCGESAGALAAFFRLERSEILAVHDDLELEFGKIGLKSGGGAAGHNGLRSLTQALGGADFKRLRLGIGRPVKGTVESFVLGKFTPDERPWLTHLSTAGAHLLERCLTGEFTTLEKTAAKIALF
jgi:peptidyl-tRNA hydrolase, PTH1 family